MSRLSRPPLLVAGSQGEFSTKVSIINWSSKLLVSGNSFFYNTWTELCPMIQYLVVSKEFNYIQLSLSFILYSSWLLPGPLLPGASWILLMWVLIIILIQHLLYTHIHINNRILITPVFIQSLLVTLICICSGLVLLLWLWQWSRYINVIHKIIIFLVTLSWMKLKFQN